MQIYKMESLLRSFARLITQNFKVKVFFKGSKAFYTKNKIVVPPIEPTKEGISKTKFFLAHESGHDKFSAVEYAEQAHKKHTVLGHILNILEDVRIETRMKQTFPGLEKVFDTNNKAILNQKSIKKKPIDQQLLFLMSYEAYNVKKPEADKKALKIIEDVGELINKGVNSANTKEVFKYAKEIFERLKDFFDDKRHQDIPKTISEQIKEQIETEFVREDETNISQLYDENIPVEDTLSMPNEHSLSEYLNELCPLQQELNFLFHNLKNIVEEKRVIKRKRQFILNENQGRIISKRLWKVATGQSNVFKKRLIERKTVMHTDPDAALFYILGDESGSMYGERIRYARQTTIVLSEVLARLDIRFIVTGYTVEGELRRILYKQYEDNFEKLKTRLMDMHARDGTFTSEHIRFAVNDLVKRKEKQKILIVTTDATGIEVPERLKESIEIAKENNIEVVGIGIQSEEMQDYFDKYILINDLTNFSKQMLELLRDVIKR